MSSIESWSDANFGFAWYADESNIYLRSRRAGERVMQSLTRFITTKLKLKVNEANHRFRRGN
jgi:RNA-directed DNA polymerase